MFALDRVNAGGGIAGKKPRLSSATGSGGANSNAGAPTQGGTSAGGAEATTGGDGSAGLAAGGRSRPRGTRNARLFTARAVRHLHAEG